MPPWNAPAGTDPDILELVLAGEPTGPASPGRRLFVNRHLRLDSIHQVGFDLDYTLAVYRKEPMETLQFRMTLERLIEQRGYPVEAKVLSYDPALVLRGLVVDKRRGNLLKMDAHDHICRAMHGRRLLDREERRDLYRLRRIRLPAERYASLDSLFAIPEGALYAALVDFFDRRLAAGQPMQPVAEQDGSISYEKIFTDVRECIDALHADGSLKSLIVADLGRFIERDRALSATLHKLRSSGKRLFLLTNSGFAYTNHLMRFLLDGAAEEYPTWRNYFDVVVVEASKPSFFTERAPFLVLDETGEVKGTFSRGRFDRGIVYARGNIRDFERMAGAYGDAVLYVGDHIYGDILRSKKDTLWRTALITPEVEEEATRLASDHAEHEHMAALDRRRRQLDDALNDLRAFLPRVESIVHHDPVSRGERLGALELRGLDELERALRLDIDQRRRELKQVSEQVEALHDELDDRFNATWGRVFKEGNELSRFGSQVEEYACVYTSRVTNFVYYSPLHYFRAPLDRMAHERTDVTSDGHEGTK
ncbi:MAG: HAD-IG family 5'-nucleotidase [Pseudomonadota bacterium]